jgi:hypothetical protein
VKVNGALYEADFLTASDFIRTPDAAQCCKSKRQLGGED